MKRLIILALFIASCTESAIDPKSLAHIRCLSGPTVAFEEDVVGVVVYQESGRFVKYTRPDGAVIAYFGAQLSCMITRGKQ